MSKLLDTEKIFLLKNDHDQKVVDVECYCETRKIYVIRHLLSQEECENMISWMNSETRHEELGIDSR